MLKKTLLTGLALAMTMATTMAIAQDPLSIVYIGKNTGNPYFDSITGGFEDACKSLGCEFEFVAPATAEATSQIPFIEAQIQRGVDVIAIAPNSPDALNQVLDSAKAAGILVLTAFALALDAVVTVVEKRLMKWQPRGGETEKL